MKIWYQSSARLTNDPKMHKYQEALKSHVQNISMPDTKVHIYGVKSSHLFREHSCFVEYLHQAQIIDNAIQAEKEGYDAFCMACTSDPGYYEIREVVTMPVTFLSECCIHLATILADTFSFITPVIDAINDDNLLVPIVFALEQNYPNPFNPKTVIRYSVGANDYSPVQNVDLSIYNILGQKVATLVNKKQPAGTYSVQWDASGFASGVYVYKLETGNGYRQVKKLVLLK